MTALHKLLEYFHRSPPSRPAAPADDETKALHEREQAEQPQDEDQHEAQLRAGNPTPEGDALFGLYVR